ncbi:MAG: glycosyltransferase family 2 protein [Sphaerochaeta sp.]|jgi:hypothetical protein|nr:glycosyltransferase family 2 protein [Sphaerochaeta sp.]
MLLITSTLGPSNRYPNVEVMKKTLEAFLHSIDNQTRKNVRVFIACHDVPIESKYDFIEWGSVAVDDDQSYERTMTWIALPDMVSTEGLWKPQPFDYGITDMSRKTYHGAIMAGRWAIANGLKEFWMLRMDSDDLLANDMVAYLEALDVERPEIKAVYNRNCHMIDYRSKIMAEHSYPYSTTCNAMKMKVEEDGSIKNLYYHCRDHTKFMSDVHRDEIPSIERDWELCITTNNGNSLSGRPMIEREKYNRIIKINRDLEERYGLRSIL